MSFFWKVIEGLLKTLCSVGRIILGKKIKIGDLEINFLKIIHVSPGKSLGIWRK